MIAKVDRCAVDEFTRSLYRCSDRQYKTTFSIVSLLTVAPPMLEPTIMPCGPGTETHSGIAHSDRTCVSEHIYTDISDDTSVDFHIPITGENLDNIDSCNFKSDTWCQQNTGSSCLESAESKYMYITCIHKN